MRRLQLLVVVSCAASLFIGVGPAVADNGPHVAGAGVVADSCAGCHRAHTAKGSALLKESTQTGLCYTCHGSSATGANTDVEDGVGYSGSGRSGGAEGALRGGGFSYALIDASNPTGQGSGNTHVIPVRSTGQSVNSTHSVDGSSQTAWGNGSISGSANYGATVQLRCGSCHDPHGNGNYRILKPIPSQSGVASPGVVISDASTKAYTTTNYWNDDDTNASQFVSNVASWCSTCHTRYNAPSGSGKTDSGDAVFRYRHRTYSSSGSTYTTCSQCHVAHGSNASMGGTNSGNVNYPDGSSAGTGSRLLRIDNRGTCQMCHNK